MRVIGWFSKLLLSVVLISFLSIFTTVYIVDLYINKFLEQWNMSDTDTVRSDIDAEDYISKLIDPSQLMNQAQSTPTDDDSPNKPLDKPHDDSLDDSLPVFNQGSESDDEQESSQLMDSTNSTNNGQTNQVNGQSPNTTSLSTNPAVNESPSQSPSSSSIKLEDTLVMSAQEFNDKRKKLTNKDKTEIFSIVITKFPQKELQKMSLLLEDGITEEELSDLEDVMNAYLEQEDVTKLLAILNKY